MLNINGIFPVGATDWIWSVYSCLGHGGNDLNPHAFFWVPSRAETLFHIGSRVEAVEYMTEPHKLPSVMQMERDVIVFPGCEGLWGDGWCLRRQRSMLFPGWINNSLMLIKQRNAVACVSKTISFLLWILMWLPPPSSYFSFWLANANM